MDLFEYYQYGGVLNLTMKWASFQPLEDDCGGGGGAFPHDLLEDWL